MKAVTELEKHGYVFSVAFSNLVYSSKNENPTEKQKQEICRLFAELVEHKSQAVAYLLARDMPADCMVNIEDLPKFRALHHVRVVGFHWQGATPTLEVDHA